MRHICIGEPGHMLWAEATPRSAIMVWSLAAVWLLLLSLLDVHKPPLTGLHSAAAPAASSEKTTGGRPIVPSRDLGLARSS
jgi:hypothetical protein